jgi:cytochrome P450
MGDSDGSGRAVERRVADSDVPDILPEISGVECDDRQSVDRRAPLEGTTGGGTMHDRDEGPQLPILDLNDPEFWQDIHTPLAEAMDGAALAGTTDGTLYALRAAEVELVLKDPRFLAADLLALMGLREGSVWEWWQTVMFSQNPPEHTRLRALVSRAFTPLAVERMRPGIRARAREILRPAIDVGSLDAQGDLGHRLPLSVMRDLLGIPDADREAFADWTTDLGLAFSAALDPVIRARVENALAGLEDYVTGLIEDRRKTLSGDFLSELITAEEAGDRLSTAELVTMVENLLFAGHDTTRGALAAMVLSMARYPDQRRAVDEDRSLLANAVDESLRFEAITFSTSRMACEDVSVAGTMIEQGQTVGVCLPAASRDPRRYDRPHVFDIRRENIRPPTFGAGIHYCLGAALARAEMEEALDVLLDGCSAIELDGPIRWMPLAHIRRFESSLRVQLQGR